MSKSEVPLLLAAGAAAVLLTGKKKIGHGTPGEKKMAGKSAVPLVLAAGGVALLLGGKKKKRSRVDPPDLSGVGMGGKEFRNDGEFYFMGDKFIWFLERRELEVYDTKDSTEPSEIVDGFAWSLWRDRDSLSAGTNALTVEKSRQGMALAIADLYK